ncbi:MAG: carbohydrate porin [Polyangiaceae bacterium]
MRALPISSIVTIALFFSGISFAQNAPETDAGAPSTAAPLVPPPSGNNTTTPAAAPTTSPANGDATPPNAIPKPAPNPNDGFQFGSYGRVQIASDGRGGTGRPANVIAHGTRIDEDSYAELEVRREDTFQIGDASHPEIHSKVVATVAFFPPFFHFSGAIDQAIAIRNLFAQASYGNATLWVGSRMYRGDDIYLLDWWPLDNQNTVGGGGSYQFKSDDTSDTIAIHAGMQRLDSTYQYEQIPVVAPFGDGTVNVTQLDRPRLIESFKFTHLMHGTEEKKFFGSPTAGFKVIGYGELHEISGGVYHDTTTEIDTSLPSDTGFLIGTELGLWTGKRDTHVSLFLRHARGIAAYDPLETPLTFANDRTTSGSSETLAALGSNWENDHFGVMTGAYVRFFRDGSSSPTSTQKYDEGTVVVRPEIFIGEHWGVALEGSYQARRLAVLDAATNQPITASLWRGGIIPYFSPSGRGSFKRPQLRIIYAFTARNQGAEDLYPKEDVFSQRTVEHYIGLGAEWWFNSSSYP